MKFKETHKTVTEVPMKSQRIRGALLEVPAKCKKTPHIVHEVLVKRVAHEVQTNTKHSAGEVRYR